MSYDKYYKAKLEAALLYQDFVIDVSMQAIGLAIVQYASRAYQQGVGESRTGVEIKHDDKFRTTGNLWIETAEKAKPRPGDYASSGIYRNDNAWLYVIGDYDTIFYFSKRFLQQLHASERYQVRENHTKTSLGFCLPEIDAHRYAVMVLKPKAQQKIAKLAFDLAEAGKLLHQIVKANPAQQTLFSQDGEQPISGERKA